MKALTIPVQPVDRDSDASCSNDEPFALMVLGDSMAPEFIEGDVIVVEPGGFAANGSFVIARIGQDWTLRRLDRHGDRWKLVSVNPGYSEDVEIGSLNDVKGVVVQRTHPRWRARRKRYVD